MLNKKIEFNIIKNFVLKVVNEYYFTDIYGPGIFLPPLIR